LTAILGLAAVSDNSRPTAIEDPTNRLVVHRLSAVLLPWAVRTRIHPNAVSIIGLAFAGGAGTAYHYWRSPWLVLLGFALTVAWHVCDGLDGQLARATGRASALGRLVDGVCDYLAFFAILIPVATSFPDWGDKLTLCLTAGAAHAFQAAYYEGVRDAWVRRSQNYFEPRARPALGNFLERGHNALERLISGRGPLDAMLRVEPARLPAALAATAPWVRALQPLSANGRTLVLPLCCLLGHAEWFWWWELVGLNIYAVFVTIGLRNAEGRIVAGRAGMLHRDHRRPGGDSGFEGAE